MSDEGRAIGQSDRMRLVPGESVMTERAGRFFAVGFVTIEGTDSIRQARCCDDGHVNPDDIDECWKDPT